jgi:hypothetical protein
MAGREGGTPIDQSVISRLAQGLRYAFSGKTAQDFFGPGTPIAPAAQEAAVGRQFDYPTGYNISIQPRSGEAITFAQLRGLADSHDLLRLAIETRKDQMAKLQFKIKPKDEGASSDARCKKIQDFLESPDQENDWDDWLRMWLEEVFVTDAPAIYPRRTKGGELYALEHIDGSTIKRVLSADGRTPLPPDPAYQQVIKGIPAVDYTKDELVYIPRNKRTSRIYGYSPVEQIIMTVNIALRRQVVQLSYYTEGNIPPMLVAVPKEWNTDQIEMFQKYWDLLMSNDAAKKQQLKFVPGDMKTQLIQTQPLFDIADEWLARVICYAMNLPPNAFVKQMNRATAGTAQEVALQEGLAPIMRYIARKMTRMIQIYFNAPDLEFVWEDQTDVDALVQAQIDKIYVDAGIDTPDEVREARGMTALPDGLGKKPKVPVTPITDPGVDPAGGGDGGTVPGKPQSKKGNQDGVTAAAAEKAQPADTRARDYALLVENGIAPNVAAKQVGLEIEKIEGGDVPMISAKMIPLSLATDPTGFAPPAEKVEKREPQEPINLNIKLEPAAPGKPRNKRIVLKRGDNGQLTADLTETDKK